MSRTGVQTCVLTLSCLPPRHTQEHDAKTIKVLPRDLDASARRRARFCMQLNSLSPLQRYDVLSAVSLRFAIRECRAGPM